VAQRLATDNGGTIGERIDVAHIHNSSAMAISMVTQIRTSHVFFSIMARTPQAREMPHLIF
jgi:hypothetical protein